LGHFQFSVISCQSSVIRLCALLDQRRPFAPNSRSRQTSFIGFVVNNLPPYPLFFRICAF
jgi:hypothetical protein